MTVLEAKKYCLTKPGAFEDYPFDNVTPVIKVMKKMFALFGENSVSLKCDPFLSGDLRAQYKAITPGYHLNKEHWNTVLLDGSVPDDTITFLIDMSYELVTKKNSKKQ
ncbi:MAG TPA: MmcQ/YjbR family DNA-binding protein [Ruminiclostridium sp.]|nr:MmcQ/YjbR family DNA-binding protein [Ruminiclostridium sp.]